VAVAVVAASGLILARRMLRDDPVNVSTDTA
jgi:hypothetical protein